MIHCTKGNAVALAIISQTNVMAQVESQETMEKESLWKAKLANFNMTTHLFDWGLRLRSGPFDWPQLIMKDRAPVMSEAHELFPCDVT
jgi:hypothetical protein